MTRGETGGQAAPARVAAATTLGEALAAGEFAVTAELGPPRNPDAEVVRRTARALAGVVHAANVTDNQAASVKVSPLACSVWMLEEGLDPIMQVTTRDRNLMALQADLLGAWAVGVRAILALSGDPLHVGPYADLAKPVWDLDSMGLIRLAAGLNEGRLAAGETLDAPTGFLIAGAANPLVDSVEKLESKIDAGAHCLQTNIVYDVERFAGWFGPVVEAGVTARAPVIVGVAPPRSTRMLRHLHDRVPGVEVDERTFARMDGLEGDDAKDAGVEIAVDVVRRLREVPGVAGVHLMAPGWEAEAVPRVAADAGLRVVPPR
jgi:methylenetetrahydrofolate reductase (NADPH)